MKRIVGLSFAAVAATVAVVLFWAASSKVGVPKKEALWAADRFLQLGAVGLTAVVLSVGFSVLELRSGVSPKVTRLFDVVAFLGLSAASGFTLLQAVAAERQNYWDAIHFSTLVWAGLASALAAVVLSAWGGEKDGTARAAGWLPGALLAGWVLVWMVTWFGPLSDFIAWTASSWYLMTHG